MSIFDGDGRTKVQPVNVFPGTRPKIVTRSTARLMIAHLLRCRVSTHSLSGSTLWIVITYCLETKTDFRLNVYPGQGYFVELKRPTRDRRWLRCYLARSAETMMAWPLRTRTRRI